VEENDGFAVPGINVAHFGYRGRIRAAADVDPQAFTVSGIAVSLPLKLQ
jgi:hypothetical protein